MLDLASEVRAGVLAALDELTDTIRAAVRAELKRASADPDRLLPAREAAALIGLSESALRKAAQRGTIPCQRIGRRLRFRAGDLLDLGVAKTSDNSRRRAR